MEELENKNEEITDTIEVIKQEFDKKLAEQLETHKQEMKELEEKLKCEHNAQIKALLSGASIIKKKEEDEEDEDEDEVEAAVKRLTEKFKRRK